MGHYLSKKVPSHFLWVKPSQIFCGKNHSIILKKIYYIPYDVCVPKKKYLISFFSINTYFFPAAAACYSLFLYTAYKFPV